MKKYEMTSARFDGSVEFGYCEENGWLVYFKQGAGMTADQHRFLLEHMPLSLTALLQLKSPTVAITEVMEQVPTFDEFWAAYNYKVDKEPARKVWTKLSDADKLKAMKAIKAYDHYLQKKQIDKVYAVRYLRNRRFEDEFTKI